jgi:hypothetical protein
MCQDPVQVVVVLSGSMEPAYYRGDILFLNMGRRPVRVGEVVVFNIEGRDIPIVHRVVKVHERRPGAAQDEIEILTKARPSRPVLAARACGACPQPLRRGGLPRAGALSLCCGTG